MPLSMLELPKIRLLVPLVLVFLVPPLFLHGLNTWLAKYWVPVKNLVLGWFRFRPWGLSLVRLGLFWGAEEARTRRVARTVRREICIFFSRQTRLESLRLVGDCPH